MNIDDLVADLAELVARHDVTGREFVAACLRVAEGYFEPDDLPPMLNVAQLLESLRR